MYIYIYICGTNVPDQSESTFRLVCSQFMAAKFSRGLKRHLPFQVQRWEVLEHMTPQAGSHPTSVLFLYVFVPLPKGKGKGGMNQTRRGRNEQPTGCLVHSIAQCGLRYEKAGQDVKEQGGANCLSSLVVQAVPP